MPSQDNDPRSAPPKIRIRGLKKSFGQNVVLDGVDLDIWTGDNLVLLGASGTGKSVLVKCILGLLRPDAGSILFDGRDVRELSSEEREQMRRKTGVLFQNGALFDSLTVWRNVAFGLMHGAGFTTARAREIAIEKLAAVGLGADAADLPPSALSGGMQKRVALARAIATDPEILFLDDPTAGLDPILTTIIDQFIMQSIDALGATALTITQDIESARRMADRMAVLHGGRIVWEGPADAVDSTGNPHVDEIVQPSLAARRTASDVGSRPDARPAS
jgi:phospholipid/cholesterol/gamma-HCH transport system ATP-binding protein